MFLVQTDPHIEGSPALCLSNLATWTDQRQRNPHLTQKGAAESPGGRVCTVLTYCPNKLDHYRDSLTLAGRVAIPRRNLDELSSKPLVVLLEDSGPLGFAPE